VIIGFKYHEELTKNIRVQKKVILGENGSRVNLVPDGTISASVDLTPMVEAAEKHVSGKSLLEALFALTMLGLSPEVKKLRKQAEDNRTKYIAQSLFPKVLLNGLGRVIASQPQDPEESLLADMYSNANHSRSIRVQGAVESARQRVVVNTMRE
jgi:hypothetical protein